MEETSTTPRSFNVRLLPWILGAVFLVLYWITLHPWVAPSNVMLLGQLTGWDVDPPVSEPLLYLVSLLFRWAPAAKAPWVLNAVAAVVGALNVVILARCVALLPHDRTREQRIRGHGEDTLLHGWFSSLPIVFAAGLLGLQLTFWENATLQTGEMLDLLLFSFCILALLEYRISLREGWMWAAALAWGVGISCNWAMIGFAPLFLVAILWIRGLSFFNAVFLTRLLLFGLLGLSFYLVFPLISAVVDFQGIGFWPTLKSNLLIEKGYLLGVPRGRPLLLGLISVLPLGLVAIRWEGVKGSSIENYASFGAVVLLQVLWLAAAVYVVFDPPFSSRQLIHLDPSAGGMPLLTFGFTGALAAGYLAGWFLLVGFVSPSKTWDQPAPLFAFLAKAAAVVTLVATVGTPAVLLVRNWQAIRSENNDDSLTLAKSWLEPLPAQPAIVLVDNPLMASLAQAAALARPGTPHHVFFQTVRGPDARYRQWLARTSKEALPQLSPIGTVQENVAGVTTEIIVGLAKAGRAFYLHPSFGFFFEQLQPKPAGVIFKLVPQPEDLVPQVGTPEQAAAALKAWESLAVPLNGIATARDAGGRDGRSLVEIWARTGNAIGVELQRQGRFKDAGRVFTQVRNLNPDNRAAAVNASVNAQLQAGRSPGPELFKPLADALPLQVLNQDGPVDEPIFLRNYGSGLLSALERLPRQAWDVCYRSQQLGPKDPSAPLGQIEALLQANQLPQARAALDRLTKSEFAKSPTREFQAGIQRLEIYYSITQGDIAGAEKRIENARTQFSGDTSLLDMLTEIYIRQRRYDDAIPLLEQWRKQRPEEAPATLRLAAIHITRAQYEPAQKILDQLLAIQPDNAAARLNRAICLLQLNRLDDARREYLAVSEKLPDLPMVKFGLAEISLRRGNTNDAIVHFEKYLQLAQPNTAEYTNVAQRVIRLRGQSR